MPLFILGLFLLMQFSVSTAGHFWGGSMTFSPKGVYPDGSYKVEFRFKITFDNCGYLSWNHCFRGDCGTQISVERGVIYNTAGRNAEGFNWCQTEGVMTRQIPADYPFALREYSCCWVDLANSVAYWSLLTVVDLGNRSDTNKANRSPVTTSISFVRVPQNCPRTYKLIMFDPDNDQARCRYGNVEDYECIGCQLPPGFRLNQTRIKEKDFCTLSYDYSSVGVYGLELTVEDFPKQNINLFYKNGSPSIRSPFNQTGINTLPLSKLPLHFAVKVDPAVESCDEGVYLPKFLHPTPENGEQIQAKINQELEIIISATASATVVHDIIISGPLNITVNTYNNGSEQFVLRWTPRADNLGEYFPVCFIAESHTVRFGGRRQDAYLHTYYQSDMRCVIVEVGNNTDSDSAVPTGESTKFPLVLTEIVAGLRVKVESETSLTEAEIEEMIIKPFQEELIRNGLPNSTTLSLRRVYQIDP